MISHDPMPNMVSERGNIRGRHVIEHVQTQFKHPPRHLAPMHTQPGRAAQRGQRYAFEHNKRDRLRSAARCCSMCCLLPYWMPLVDAVLNVVVWAAARRRGRVVWDHAGRSSTLQTPGRPGCAQHRRRSCLLCSKGYCCPRYAARQGLCVSALGGVKDA